MTAQREEVIIDTDLRYAQHLGKQSTQDILSWRARATAQDRGRFRRGQRGRVDLAVHPDRQAVQHDNGRRHHVLRQPTPRVLPHQLRPRPLPRRHHVGHQALVLRPVLPDDHRDLADIPVLAEHRLDLGQLDAEPAHLDLVVDPAAELERRAPPRDHVPGPVHPGAGRSVRIGHEPLGRQSGPSQVPPGHAVARHVQFAGLGRPQVGVQHVGPGVRDGPGDHRLR
ncbi:hypothetical protein GCM10010174_47510 [Kutzneria viridogrisea]